MSGETVDEEESSIITQETLPLTLPPSLPTAHSPPLPPSQSLPPPLSFTSPCSLPSQHPQHSHSAKTSSALLLEPLLAVLRWLRDGHRSSNAMGGSDRLREKRGDCGIKDESSRPLRYIDGDDEEGPQVFKRRWAMLVMFIILSASNGAQWIEYAIIAPVISSFYGVSYGTVDWTSMIYMLTYILFFIPASWLLDRFGLRVSLLLGAAGNCIGAWIKLLSTHPDGFWITFVGQTVAGASQMFTLGIPPRLAAVWFGSDEVSTACAAGVFGNQLGIAVGFVLPPRIVKGGEEEDTAWQLTILFLASAVLNSIIFVLIICFFSARPPKPPSAAQQAALGEESAGHAATLKGLMTNRDFLLLFLTYGMNTGVFYAVSTLLSQMVLAFYPSESETVGTIGLLIVVAGMLGSVVGGYLLDKFKKFKLTTIMVYVFSFLGMLSFTFTLDLGSIWIVAVNAFLLGFFMTGYLPIGFEFAAEITFPSAEGTMSGLLNASAQVFGIALTIIAGRLIESFSILTCNITMSAVLVVGTLLTALIREKLKRQNAHKQLATVPQSVTALTAIDA